MKIAVVGMGPAGLRTMMLLKESGHEVHGFEARDRVGGRLKTVRTEAGFYEGGGEWIDADHHRLIALLKQLGQEPVKADLYPGTVWMAGKPYVEDEYQGHQAVLDQVEEEADKLALDLDDVPWNNALYANLDQQTLGGWLDQQAGKASIPRRILESVYRSDEGEDTHEVGLLGWLCARLAYLERTGGEMSSARFPNGAQGFCEAMAERGGPITFGAALQQITLDGCQIGLTFNDQDPKWFDRVVLAIPAGCLRDITFEPGISEAKQEAFEAARMSRTIKISLHFDAKFWTGSSRILTDGLLQQAWSAQDPRSQPQTPNSELPTPIVTLLTYIGGQAAIDLALMGEEAAGRTLVAELERVMPGAETHYLKATLHDWVHDDFSGGGFFCLPPGYVLDHYEALVRPENGLYFAGDYGGRWIGTIEGALESAERVTEDINLAANVR